MLYFLLPDIREHLELAHIRPKVQLADPAIDLNHFFNGQNTNYYLFTFEHFIQNTKKIFKLFFLMNKLKDIFVSIKHIANNKNNFLILSIQSSIRRRINFLQTFTKLIKTLLVMKTNDS